MVDEVLHSLHRVAVVRVRLVPLELRELGLMLVGEPFVPEVLADLVDLLQPADDQPLEIELVRDPEVVVLVERVVVRDKRLRKASAVTRLEDGRLHLDKPLGVEPPADLSDDPGSLYGELARIVVHEQVEVALAVPRLLVLNAVKGVG